MDHVAFWCNNKKTEDVIFWGSSLSSDHSFQVQSPDSHQLSSKTGVQSFSSSPSCSSRAVPGWRDRRGDPAR